MGHINEFFIKIGKKITDYVIFSQNNEKEVKMTEFVWDSGFVLLTFIDNYL